MSYGLNLRLYGAMVLSIQGLTHQKNTQEYGEVGFIMYAIYVHEFAGAVWIFHPLRQLDDGQSGERER